MYLVVTIALVFFLTKFSLSQSVEALVEGSNYILVRLFSVGIFLGFINMIGDIGAFETIVGIARNAPIWLMVPAAVLAGFLVGVPAGAYVGSILALILPVTIALNFSPLATGFVVMGGHGPGKLCNITMQALSSGFQIPIIEVVKGTPSGRACTIILLAISLSHKGKERRVQQWI